MRNRVIILVLLLLPSYGCDGPVESKLGRGIEAPPPAHPAMDGKVQPQQSAPSNARMPSGHPPISQQGSAGNTTPSGHPPVDGSAAKPSTSGSGAKVNADGRMQIGGISFLVPSGWVSQKPSMSMRLAQFALPKVEGDSVDGVITVILAGGNVQSNIERWSGQFAESPPAKPEVKEVGGVKVTVVRLEGTFRGMGGSGKPGTMLLGAVVEVPGSSQSMFFKGTGPKATMSSWSASFDDMVASIKLD